MSDAQAGTTPATPPENREAGQDKAAEAGSGLNAQQQKEFMVLKQKAEEFNRLEAEKKALEARLAQMERVAVSQGAGQATDPEAEDIAALREAASYDPVARQTLRNKAEALQARAEAWLAKEVAKVPEAKRAQVEDYIRAYGYQVDARYALERLTDPETVTLSTRLKDLEAENAALKARSVQPHGTSPAATPLATEAGAPQARETIPGSEAIRTLKAGGPAAKALRDKMDSGAVRPDWNH